MINNRQQSGRRRGRGGQRQGGNPGSPNSGNRIDSRARGNANQLYEKYKNLATEAQRQGDRVNTEYYFQFADHYFRVLSESRSRFDDQQQRQQRSREDSYDEGDEGEEYFGDEGEAIRPGEMTARQQGQANGQGGQGGQPRREDSRRDEGRRDDNRREDSRRDDRSYEGRRDERRYEERRPRGEDGGRFNGQPRSEQQQQRDLAERPAVEAAESEPSLPMPDVAAAEPAPSRRRGRPRKAEQAEAPAALDADRLPPALGVPANDSDDAPAEAKPRRRRSPRSAAAEAEAPAAE